MMDALRDNVYCCIYTYDKGELKPLTDYMALSIEELLEILKAYKENIYFVGDGASLHRDYLSQNVKASIFAPNHLNFPRASTLGELGLKELLKGNHDELNISAPIYLRKPQAEREYEAKWRNKNAGI